MCILRIRNDNIILYLRVYDFYTITNTFVDVPSVTQCNLLKTDNNYVCGFMYIVHSTGKVQKETNSFNKTNSVQKPHRINSLAPASMRIEHFE